MSLDNSAQITALEKELKKPNLTVKRKYAILGLLKKLKSKQHKNSWQNFLAQ